MVMVYKLVQLSVTANCGTFFYRYCYSFEVIGMRTFLDGCAK